MTHRSTIGWLDLLKGVLLLIVGIVALLNPQIALPSLVVLFGITAIVSGITDIAAYARLNKQYHNEPAMMLVTGIINLVMGVILFLFPTVGQWMLYLVIPFWFIARCVSRIMGFGLMKELAGKGVSIAVLCLNILGLFFGILMLFSPALFTMSMGILIAINLILMGASSMVEAFSRLGAQDDGKQRVFYRI